MKKYKINRNKMKLKLPDPCYTCAANNDAIWFFLEDAFGMCAECFDDDDLWDKEGNLIIEESGEKE